MYLGPERQNSLWLDYSYAPTLIKIIRKHRRSRQKEGIRDNDVAVGGCCVRSLGSGEATLDNKAGVLQKPLCPRFCPTFLISFVDYSKVLEAGRFV